MPYFSAKLGWREGWLMGAKELSSEAPLLTLQRAPVGRLGCRPSASQQELLGVQPAEA